jgi:hypothetical protein
MHRRLHGRRASYLQNTASTRAAEKIRKAGDQGHAQATPRHCTFFLEMGNFAGTSKLSVRSGQVQGSKLMNGLIYLVGLVVVILAVLSFFGLR